MNSPWEKALSQAQIGWSNIALRNFLKLRFKTFRRKFAFSLCRPRVAVMAIPDSKESDLVEIATGAYVL
jgi:hypothetical protein